MEKNRGFTLIELLIVIVIIVIFSGLTIPSYNLQTQQLKLKKEGRKLANTIELAKKKAVASELEATCSNFNGFRVEISANNYSLVRLCDTNQTLNTYTLPTNITITSETGNLNFPPGGFNINLTINTITLKNSKISQCLNISLSSIGLIEVSNSLTGC